MRRERVRALLDDVAAGTLNAGDALDALALEPIESLGFATIDHHRSLRQGYPEVIFAPGKTADQAVTIAEHIAARGDGFLVTRADAPKREALAARFADAEINELARTVYLAPLTPAQPVHRCPSASMPSRIGGLLRHSTAAGRASSPGSSPS